MSHRVISHRASLWALPVVVVIHGCGGDPPPAAPPPASLFSSEVEHEPPSTATPGPTPGASPGPAGHLQFTDVAAQWGIATRHHAGRHEDKWLPETMTGGVALVDVDRNGALDIVLVDGGDLEGAPADEVGPHLLLGDGRGGFVDATSEWELTHRGYGMGVAAGDVDGDGWVDLYLTTYDASDRLLRNEDGRRFVDVTAAWGLVPAGWSTSAAFLDIEGDGDLDLYVTRYVSYELATAIKCYLRRIHVYCTPGMYEPQTDLLWRNDGGHLVEVSQPSGIAAHPAKGLAVGTGDLDGDGDTDLYVANDTSRNLLLLNDGRGRFDEQGVRGGVAYSELGREEASMGVAVADSDADGRWDIAVTNFQAEPTSLYTRRPDGTYRERSDAAGIGASARARLSFGIEWIDADNDGDEDLLTANGHVTDNVGEYRDTVQFQQLDSLYERVGDGQFLDVSATAGTALLHRGVGRGLAVGDLDGDGALDYVVVDNDGPLHVGRNTTEDRGHWLSLWLEGRTANRSAVGATVTATVGDRVLRREVRGASSYLSVSDRRIHLGLGGADRIDALVIRWPDGQEQQLGPLEADAHLRVVQGSEPAAYTPGAEVLPP